MVMKDENQQKAVYKDESTQNELNTPLEKPNGLGVDDKDFLDLVLSIIDDGKIDLYKPSSIINNNVYKGLNAEDQGKVDLEAINLLSAIRDIKGLCDNGDRDSFQVENLVERLKNTKERLENESGDLFII